MTTIWLQQSSITNIVNYYIFLWKTDFYKSSSLWQWLSLKISMSLSKMVNRKPITLWFNLIHPLFSHFKYELRILVRNYNIPRFPDNPDWDLVFLCIDHLGWGRHSKEIHGHDSPVFSSVIFHLVLSIKVRHCRISLLQSRAWCMGIVSCKQMNLALRCWHWQWWV